MVKISIQNVCENFCGMLYESDIYVKSGDLFFKFLFNRMRSLNLSLFKKNFLINTK